MITFRSDLCIYNSAQQQQHTVCGCPHDFSARPMLNWLKQYYAQLLDSNNNNALFGVVPPVSCV